MSGLKTLKDLRYKDTKSVMGETYLIREDRLREEASKHIKEIKSQMDWWNKDKEYGHLKFLEGRIFTFENFFNITEEDLK